MRRKKSRRELGCNELEYKDKNINAMGDFASESCRWLGLRSMLLRVTSLEPRAPQRLFALLGRARRPSEIIELVNRVE